MKKAIVFLLLFALVESKTWARFIRRPPTQETRIETTSASTNSWSSIQSKGTPQKGFVEFTDDGVINPLPLSTPTPPAYP